MLSFADLFQAFNDDPTIFSDAQAVIASVASGDGGVQKVEAFTAAAAALVGHGQNAIADIVGAIEPKAVSTTSPTGAMTTVTTATTPAT
jgi:hypothetical protein